MPSVPEIARASAEKHALFASQGPVVAMVSGGADSVACLRMLADGTFGDLRILVLHVNHLLRGEEADADERFVAELAEQLGVECRTLRYDVAGFAKAERLNLEDAGRRVRYRFAEEELDAWCAARGAAAQRGRVVVAHTLDDRIETFFMRALLGSGTGGLGSIAPRRGRIVRPLLELERPALRAWLEEQGQGWREDRSNSDTDRMRAHVRATMLPAAERVNPKFRGALARTMDLLAADDALLTSMAEAFARDFAEVRPGEEVAFDRTWMSTLDATMARRTVRAALAEAFPHSSRLESEHVEALAGGLADATFARDLPDGLRAFSEYGKLIVSRSDIEAPSVAPGLLVIPGTADLGVAGTIAAQIEASGTTDATSDSVVIDAGRVTGDLIVDGPRPGDRMRPLGMRGTRKLSDLLVDEKVPKRKRGAIPVVRDGENIIWVAGVRMSDDYRVTDETTRAVRLTWRRKA